MSGKIKVEVYQQDWIPGFAAYCHDGTMEEGAAAHVVLNVGVHMAAAEVGDVDPADLPYVVAENLMHEVIHVLEAWAGVEFSEERVEALLEKYRAEAQRAHDAGEMG